MLYPRANGSKLYLPRDEEGKGLTSIENAIEAEEYKFLDYVKETNKGHNRLLKSVEKEDTKRNTRTNIKKHRTKVPILI